MTSLRPRSVRSRRAVAAAELALILPLLVTMVLGAVDFGRFAYCYIAVTNAARAGAQYACMNNFTASTLTAWKTGVKTAVTDEMTLQVGAGNVPAQPDPTTSTDNGLKRVQVTAVCNFTTIINWQWTGLGLPNTLTLQRRVEMRLIR
ncbi:MAG: TadE family protein [Gemmataceae bacterium]